MILLDHNIPQSEVKLLQSWRIHYRQVGFFRRRLCHKNYCIVVLTGSPTQSAGWIRRFLKHPEFRTQTQRCCAVVKLTPTA